MELMATMKWGELWPSPPDPRVFVLDNTDINMFSDHPEFQEKIRTAMIEGKIADEDFKGDPGWNVLGKRGIRGRSKKPKAEDQDDGEVHHPPPPVLPVTFLHYPTNISTLGW